MSWLRGEGFTTVVNLRGAAEEGVDLEGCRTAAEAAGLNYVHLPFDPRDGDTQVIDDFLAAIGDEANQPVFIHCASATRVAALWMIGRVLRDGWELDAAREEAAGIAAKPPECGRVRHPLPGRRGGSRLVAADREAHSGSVPQRVSEGRDS